MKRLTVGEWQTLYQQEHVLLLESRKQAWLLKRNNRRQQRAIQQLQDQIRRMERSDFLLL